MTLTIRDTNMTSDKTAHTARHAPSRNGWEVSWLPGQILDRNTAITAMILADTAAHADEREAHIREVEQFGQSLPEGSYGRRNRQAIAARETRVAARLRRRTCLPAGHRTRRRV